jgi:hypothetical protein
MANVNNTFMEATMFSAKFLMKKSGMASPKRDTRLDAPQILGQALPAQAGQAQWMSLEPFCS